MYEEFEEIDARLDELDNNLALLQNIQPKNIIDCKKKFFSGEEFEFEYEDLSYDAKTFEEIINEIIIPEGELHDLFEHRLNEIKLMNLINLNRKNCLEYSIKLYGKPDIALCNYAKKVLSEKFVEEEKNLTADDVKGALEYHLNNLGLTDWRVEFHDKNQTTTDRNSKTIYINEIRKYSEKDPERLAVHEVGVHAVRAENGSFQPLRLFNSGFPNYLMTEEGLAIYFEEKHNVFNSESMKKYAARVLAVDGLCRNCTFKDTFERLKIYGLSDDLSWDITTRVYRGGGFTKDHLYLKGYLQVKEYLKNNDFEELFYGKIGIEHISLIKRMKAYLTPPKHLPEF